MGFDRQLFIQPVDDIFVCGICKNVVQKPRKCNVKDCEKIYCNNCIVERLKSQSECPSCNQVIQPEEIGRIYRNFYNKMELRCPNHCGVQGNMEEIEKHLQSNCFVQDQSNLQQQIEALKAENQQLKNILQQQQMNNQNINFQNQVQEMQKQLKSQKDVMDNQQTSLTLQMLKIEEMEQQMGSQVCTEEVKVQIQNRNYKIDRSKMGVLSNLKDQWGATYSYIGEIQDNKPNGFGVALYTNNSRGIGFFQNGNFDSVGISVSNLQNDIFVGETKNGFSEGFGIRKYKNEDLYIGEFETNQKNGKGKLVRENNIIEGNWKNDKLIQ